MDIISIGETIKSLGLALSICAVAIWIAIRSYLIWESKISVQLDKQDDDMENVKHCSTRTVEILELMLAKQDAHFLECREFHNELRYKHLNGVKPE